MEAKVNLTKRVVVNGKDRFAPVVVAGNGRIKPDWVLVSSLPERHPEGTYYIDWNNDGKRHREAVGSNPAQAFARQQRKQAELRAEAQGVLLAPQADLDKRRSLDAAITDYLDDTSLSKKHKTLAAYTTSLGYFRESCSKPYVEEIERRDLLKFTAYLRDEKKLSPRTCWNKFSNVASFLKECGIRSMIKKGDWPSYVEEEPEVYEREELDKFFNACYEDERLWYTFFLQTGMREQEVMHCTWRDVNFKQGTVAMRWKPEYNWSPKAYKEREIPIPTSLMETLASVRDGRKGLLFPTANGKPKLDFWDCCKRVATRAALDPDEWWLHKFRATFATWHLQAGIDLRTVQMWLGHVDLESTMRYLRAARGAGVQEKVNATFR